ncbi:MAG: Gfo/Idh/MocA family oxidoreductase [Acidimicrobiia bacterium]|jgi:predicted dehydrogenase
MEAVETPNLRFALVGCGRIAQRYGQLLSSGAVAGASLASVCDIRADRAEDMAARHEVPWFDDMDKMMESEQPDVAVVLTESGNHAAHTVRLAEYGKPIVVEKPMALTLDDADEMIASCDRAGIKLFVVKQNRYNLPVVKLREAVESGRFGRLLLGTVRVRWCRRQDYYDQDAWRGTWAQDGGVLANQASHHIDLLKWMLGEPVSVFAKTAHMLADIEAEDTGVAVVTFASGAVGLIEATTAARPTDLEGSLSILGERGTVEIGGFAVNEMKTWRFEEELPGDEEVLGIYRENPPDVYGFGHKTYLASVVDAIRNDAPALVDGLEGRKSLELISAIYESAERGTEVVLHFQASKARLGIKD